MFGLGMTHWGRQSVGGLVTEKAAKTAESSNTHAEIWINGQPCRHLAFKIKRPLYEK